MDVIGNRPGGRLSRVSAPEHALFVYGTLQFPEVLHQLIGRCPDLAPAELTGWRAAALPRRLYPGLVADARATVRGAVLSGLSAGEWAILDAFEDDEYDLRRVDFDGAKRADPGARAGRSSRYRHEDSDRTENGRYAPGVVWTYVWTADITQRDWCAEEFAAQHLTAFATRCGGWRRTLDPAGCDS
ncbi:gamma-glutamylcyclotransferase family protein [Nocardia bhagyanarayanae]|uniref:Putative gamma-glutamylcyclotransferase n=1 Tax=Nocardia bhagyanarayanae TaxID=1215925 RepID=A0A543FCR5_9NOCA|nr:gamma-glutamylcyclotransferase family protein [Nocardia bhagyanarayanae]TQM31658.1 gamma-glutamylcyclotransferase (GGCT)/AIG2-like uncharacterized protein YtfP [Nocardia bhagyanarayanae]